ncbi:MAG TPA: hypothetical protein VGH98_03345 [Gemmatimonadaceae bacterium]|jgi:DNA-binding NtrC family response regulator
MTTNDDRTAPRVLVVMGDQWRRALLRGALREAGYDAVGARGMREARVVQPALADRGPVRLLVVDQDTLIGANLADLEALRKRHADPGVILLARTTIPPPAGPWTRVLRRPVSVADLVSAVEAFLPLPPELHHAIDAR